MTKLFSPIPNSLHKLRPTDTPAVTPTVRNAPKNIQPKCLTRKFKGATGLHCLFLKGSLHVTVIQTEVAWTFLSFPNQIYQLQDPLLQKKTLQHSPFLPESGIWKPRTPRTPFNDLNSAINGLRPQWPLLASLTNSALGGPVPRFWDFWQRKSLLNYRRSPTTQLSYRYPSLHAHITIKIGIYMEFLYELITY